MLTLRGFLYDLPSRGKGYPGIELIDGEAVRLTKFVNRDIRNLSTSATSMYKQYQVFIDAVLMQPEALKKNFGEMFTSDANAMLFAARVLSFGPEYRMPYMCGTCGYRGIDTFSLENAEVTMADDDFNPDNIEFTASTFDKKTEKEETHEIVLGLQRIKDEKIVEQAFKQMAARKQITGSETERSQLRLAQQIKELDGDANNSIESKFFFLDKLTIESVQALNRKLQTSDFGINTEQTVACVECGTNNEVRLAMSKEFFPS